MDLFDAMNAGRRIGLALCLVLAGGGAAAQPAGPRVTLAAEDDAAPWSYADGTGYANTLVRAAFEAAGWTVQIEVMTYARCKAQTLSGRWAGCLTMGDNEALRRELLYPRRPLFEAHNVLVAHADAPFSGCGPAEWGRGLIVGFTNGYEYIDKVEALRESRQLSVDVASSEVGSLRKLADRRIDAALLTLDEVKRLEYVTRLARLPNSFKPICDYGGNPSYVAFSRRHPQGAAARDAFDRGMRLLQERGELARLQQQWAHRALDLAAAKPH